MTLCVADASFCGAWLLEDESSDAAEELLRFLEIGEADLVVPALWHYEMLNLLRSAHRRGRLDRDAVDAARGALGGLPLRGVDHPDATARERIHELAFRHDLSAYDAAYLELAQRLRVQIASFDKPLRAAAVAESVELFSVA